MLKIFGRVCIAALLVPQAVADHHNKHHHHHSAKTEWSEEQFKLNDKNGDGFVDLSEVDTAMDHKDGHIDKKKEHDEFADENHKLFKESDKNHDGKLNHEEFGKFGTDMKLMEKDHEEHVPAKGGKGHH